MTECGKMEKQLLTIIYFVATVCTVISTDIVQKTHEALLFDKFVQKYDKPYTNNTIEYRKRLAIFMGNYRDSELLNLKRTHNVSAWFGITKFSDLTPEEFRTRYLSGYIPAKVSMSPDLDTVLHFSPMSPNTMPASLPQKIDWRDKKVVTPVKNQQSCGGCWAFSTVEGLESDYAIKTGRAVSLSVQQLMDCSLSYRGILGGCAGGQPCAALSWLNVTKTALETESNYPLKNHNQYCMVPPKASKGVRVTDYDCRNFVGFETYMLQHLATKGPLSVAVDASNWLNYQGGIIQYHCPSSLNHAVQIVGYDLTGVVPYYIVRNSWGADWGQAGYLRLRYGVNICGVASETSWATAIDIDV